MTTDPIVANFQNVTRFDQSWAETYAARIREDIGAHVEALCAAGLFQRIVLYGSFAYVVVQPEPPHIHDWRWHPSLHRTVWCIDEGCQQSFEPVWGTPAEWPKYDGEVPS